MNSMPAVLQLVTPEPALMAAFASQVQQGEQGSSDGFSALLNERRTALETEKQSSAAETEPVEGNISASEQQIMTAFAAAAQMTLNTPAAPTSDAGKLTHTQSQNNDSALNVTAMLSVQQRQTNDAATIFADSEKTAHLQEMPPAGTEFQPTTPQQQTGRMPAATLQPKQVVDSAQNVPAQLAALQREQAVTPVSGNQNDQLERTTTPAGTVAQQKLQAAYQADAVPHHTAKQLSVQTVTTAPPVEPASVASAAVPAMEPMAVAEPPLPAEQQRQTIGRMPEVASEPDVRAADITAEQTEQLDPAQVVAKPIASESVNAPTSEPLSVQNVRNAPALPTPTEVEIALSQPRPVTLAALSAATAARTIVAAMAANGSESGIKVPQQPVTAPSTEAPAPVTAETLQPAAQQLQQDTGSSPEVVTPEQTVERRGQKSHAEISAIPVNSLITKQPATHVEAPATAAETAELTASAVVDVRTTPGQRALRGTATQHDLKTAVDAVQSRTQPATSVKEMTTAQQNVVPTGETANPDGSPWREGEQTDSRSQSGNQTMMPAFSVQQKTEHQLATSAKITAEPAQQELPAQIARQVWDRLTQHELKPGAQQISLALSPENLGEVKMNLSLQGQRLTVEIVTDNRVARDAIMQHVDTLKETLARQNITMESFDVTTGGKGSGTPGQNQNAWQELAKKQQQQQLWTSTRGYATAQADLPSDAAAYQSNKGRSMLDIHY